MDEGRSARLIGGFILGFSRQDFPQFAFPPALVAIGFKLLGQGPKSVDLIGVGFSRAHMTPSILAVIIPVNSAQLNSGMTDTTGLLRRYIDLIEGLDRTVLVTVEAYVGINQRPGASAAIPATLRLEVDSDLGREAMTAAIKDQIRAVTGYEPGRFTWQFSKSKCG